MTWPIRYRISDTTGLLLRNLMQITIKWSYAEQHIFAGRGFLDSPACWASQLNRKKLLSWPSSPVSWEPQPQERCRCHGPVCVYVYIHNYTPIHAICAYTSINTYVCTHTYTSTCIYVYVYIYIYIQMYMYVYVYEDVHAYTYMCTCVYIYMYICTS